ncbi:MAG: copper-binding protein, partial [Acidobacteriota bacterium]
MRFPYHLASAAVVLVSLLFSSCSQTPSTPPSQPSAGVLPSSTEEPLRHYSLHGQIQHLDAVGKIATIKHEAIGDWMGAMTMEFPVKDPGEFAKLKEGAPIDATV